MNAAFVIAVLLAYPVLAVLVSPPHGWIALHPFAGIPLLWVFNRLSPGRAFLAGWLVGFAVDLGLFYWLAHTAHSFFGLSPWAGVGALLVFCLVYGLHLGIFAWGFARIRRASGGWWPFAIAAWLVACEFLNPQFLPYFHGSPWQAVPSLFLVSSLTGISGVSFLLALCNALGLQLVETLGTPASRRPRRVLARNAVVALSLFAFAVGWSRVRLAEIDAAEATAESIRVALVQSNVWGEERETLLASSPSAVVDDLLALSRQALLEHGPIDVFVWPEGALPGIPRSSANQAVLEFARETGSEIWMGALFQGRTGGNLRSFNSAYRIDRDGRVDRRYDKNILIPFGEYIPFLDSFPPFGRLKERALYLPGEELLVFEAPFARFAFLICYEAILSRYVRTALDPPLDLLVSISFDAWFGDTSAPHQHLLLTAAQAAQYGVPIVRSTTSGISAFVDARGVVVEQSGLFTREVLVRDVKKVRVPSFYAKTGDWFAWGCVAVSAGLFAWSTIDRRRLRRSRPG